MRRSPLPDAFPIAQGHTLVVPKRHVARLFDLSEEELAVRFSSGTAFSGGASVPEQFDAYYKWLSIRPE